MKIVSIELEEKGISVPPVFFKDGCNLIYSENNSKGKTTFLRLIFYALGYSIPSTKEINFNFVKTKIKLEVNSKIVTISRDDNKITLNIDATEIKYNLPFDHNGLLSYIFGCDNYDIINNILGVLYIDQDRGWSVLDKGTIIGQYKFNLNKLIVGLAHMNISSYESSKRALVIEKDKYDALLSMQELSEQIYKNNDEIFIDKIDKDYMDKIALIELKIKHERQALKEIENVIANQNQFLNFLKSMDLRFKYKGEEIPVSEETISNFPSSQEYLLARQSIIQASIHRLSEEKMLVESQLSKTNLDRNEDTKNIKEKILLSNKIDKAQLLERKEELARQIRIIDRNIRNRIKKSNESLHIINKINKYFLDYSSRLNVNKFISQRTSYVIRVNDENISGAIFQKIVLAYKIALIKVVEEQLRSKLFFVIDSPRGKEMDEQNTKLMSDLISSELRENQVIVASLYNFDYDRKIVFMDKAISTHKYVDKK